MDNIRQTYRVLGASDMVDTTIYIQQLTLELRKQKKRNIELCAENAQLKLQKGLLEQALERKAKWQECYTVKDDGLLLIRECSYCGHKRNDDKLENDTNYCPNCGSKMKEGLI